MTHFKRLLSYSRPYWWRIAIAAGASIAVGGMDGAFAYLVEPALKKIFSGKDHFIFALLPIGIILLFTARGACRFTSEYFMRSAGQLAVQDIRNQVYRHNLRLGLGFFNRHTTGSLMSRITNDVSVMQEGVACMTTGLSRDLISAISLLGVSFYRNWVLALITFVVIPLTVYPATVIGKRIKRLSGQGQGKMGALSSILQETFSGIKVIKAFGLEEHKTGQFCLHNNELYTTLRKSIKYDALSTPVMEFIISFGIAAVIWVGGTSVMDGRMSASEFFSFITAMVLIFTPVKRIVNTYNILQRALGAAERVFEVIDERPDIVDAPGAASIGRANGEVEFRGVSFRYGDEGYVLRDINIKAGKGEIVALVGPSGGGKSTLVSLILRFFDPSDGSVLIDGRDIRSLTIESLLRQVALVDQETVLFNDTVANNIRYGRPGATDADVERAARAAFAHAFILELPGGYQANIGDRGARLSGGQRQRICIARAILKDAPILILDEATSALDTESEQMVQAALNNLMANRTTFVIAHRLSTIIHADTIAVLESGEIVERGNHTGLLAHQGVYGRLHAMQFAGHCSPTPP